MTITSIVHEILRTSIEFAVLFILIKHAVHLTDGIAKIEKIERQLKDKKILSEEEAQ